MKRVSLNLGENSYSVLIGTGLVDGTGKHLKELGFSGKAVVITNPVVRKLYAERLTASLKASGFTPAVLEIPDGEEYKSMDSAIKLFLGLAEARADRRTPILALGGGVIGDLAGFVAATYLRGVPFIQIPTTLLSQVDSSTGGKVAVDLESLKNRIGAFYQPKLALSDVGTLKTLSERAFVSGLAEVIKHGLIRDRVFFDFLDENIKRIKALDEDVLTEMVFRSIQIKAEYVEKDERDTGIRNVLNTGHTIGHAVESASDFALSHGEAVAIGLVAEGRIAVKMGLLKSTELYRLRELFIRAGLPVEIPPLDRNRITQAMAQDKKVISGKMRFILPKTIGDVVITDEVDPKLVDEVLDTSYV